MRRARGHPHSGRSGSACGRPGWGDRAPIVDGRSAEIFPAAAVPQERRSGRSPQKSSQPVNQAETYGHPAMPPPFFAEVSLRQISRLVPRCRGASEPWGEEAGCRRRGTSSGGNRQSAGRRVDIGGPFPPVERPGKEGRRQIGSPGVMRLRPPGRRPRCPRQGRSCAADPAGCASPGQIRLPMRQSAGWCFGVVRERKIRLGPLHIPWNGMFATAQGWGPNVDQGEHLSSHALPL